jgi:hypothetical protein
MSVQLKVDGKVIPINEFVESILGGTVTGAVTTLHGVGGDWRKIEVQIERQTNP